VVSVARTRPQIDLVSKGLDDRHRASPRQHGENCERAAHMEQRQDDHVPIVAVEEVEGLAGHRVEVTVGREHSLGRTRRTRRVDDRLRIPGIYRPVQRLLDGVDAVQRVGSAQLDSG
jgi:hypothetical protein